MSEAVDAVPMLLKKQLEEQELVRKVMSCMSAVCLNAHTTDD
jgi:hypothetical protein